MVPTLHAEEEAATAQSLPHLKVDLERGFVDVDATVVLREGEWIELLACTPGTREYEAIVTVDARPSHIHLALIMLGLEPGSPMTWRYEKDKTIITPPRGPRVAVSVIHAVDGKTVETPANRWIINKASGKPLDDNIWTFAGSSFADWRGKRIYRADAGGTVISIVNFGDDMLARPTEATNQNDSAEWSPNTDAIPELGTNVVLRLRPVKENDDAADAPTTEPR